VLQNLINRRIFEGAGAELEIRIGCRSSGVTAPDLHSTTQRHSAERVNDYHNYQDQADDADASAIPPSRISVIASASTEQEHYKNNQQ
jgi:hypothetical protein